MIYLFILFIYKELQYQIEIVQMFWKNFMFVNIFVKDICFT